MHALESKLGSFGKSKKKGEGVYHSQILSLIEYPTVSQLTWFCGSTVLLLSIFFMLNLSIQGIL